MKSYPELKGKKAVIFIGLSHHARKLKSVAEYLMGAGMEVMFLTSANIPSLGEGNCECFELYLMKTGLAYRHLYFYRTPGWKERIKEETDGLMVEMVGFLKQDDYRALLTIPPDILSYSLMDATECFFLFERMLEKEKPDILIGLHEANFWVKLMSWAGHKRHIPVLTFQEGFYSVSEVRGEKYAIMAEYSTAALWGEEAKQAILSHARGCGERLKLVGNPEYDPFFQATARELETERNKTREDLGIPEKTGLCLVLLPNPFNRYREAIPLNELVHYITSLPDTIAWIKWHPRESNRTIQEFMRLEKNGKVKHIVSGDIKHLLPACDLCLVLDSSAGFDAVMYKKPLIEINISKNQYGRSYAADGVALLIDSMEKFPLVDDILSGRKKSYNDEERNRYLEHIIYKPDGKSGKRIVELVKDLLGGTNR